MSEDLMEELLEELRRHQSDYPSLIHGPLCGQAADEIVTLRASLAKAVEALEDISRQMTLTEMEAEGEGRENAADFIGGYDAIIHIARAALAALTSPERGDQK